MKLFVQVLVALVSIVGLFLLLGFVVTEQSNINEVKVKAPVEWCWNTYQDESRISDWMEGVKEIKLTAGTSGKVGAVQKVIMSGAGSNSISSTSSSELARTITKSAKPKSFGYDYSNSYMHGKSAIDFVAQDSFTIIKSTDVFSANDLWMRSVMFLMKSSINKKTQDQFDKLKLIIEQDYKAQLLKESEDQTEIIESESN